MRGGVVSSIDSSVQVALPVFILSFQQNIPIEVPGLQKDRCKVITFSELRESHYEIQVAEIRKVREILNQKTIGAFKASLDFIRWMRKQWKIHVRYDIVHGRST